MENNRYVAVPIHETNNNTIQLIESKRGTLEIKVDNMTSKKQWSTGKIIYLIIFVIIISTTGCFETFSNFDLDPHIMRANPYLKKIDVNNETLRDYAFSVIQNVQTDEKAYLLNQIYRHIVENYQYISDPEDEEVIQSPFETIQIKGGDCEDLTILLISLLENIGINSYLVLTDTHAYALAVDINPDSLLPYVEASLLEQVEQDNDAKIRQKMNDTISLARESKWYYGGNGSILSDSFESLTITYSFISNHPITLYVVPSINDFNSFANDTTFQHFVNCQHIKQTKVNDSCKMYSYGGVILYNDGFRPATITIEIEQYFKPSFYSLFQNNTISSYSFEGKQSVVLDPTAGLYGYPGYDANVTGEKIAFDPVTKNYIYLK
jgi:hypothetical protein